MNKKKRPVIGDFVTKPDSDGSWMVIDITYNYELSVYQAKVIRVGNPSVFELVAPESLSVIEKRF